MNCTTPECMTCGSRLHNGMLEIGVDGALQVTQLKHTSIYKRGAAVFEHGQYLTCSPKMLPTEMIVW